jgi:uncharacterized membrane protein YfcA
LRPESIVFNISEAILKRIFDVFIIITGVHMIIKTLPEPASKEPPHEGQDGISG